MRKLMVLLASAVLLLAACGGPSFDVAAAEKPVYENGMPSDFILSITEDGEPAAGLTVTAVLEMAKMDHGVIEVSFEEQENGLYKGTADLPMGGEWLADVTIQSDGRQAEQLVTFDVEER